MYREQFVARQGFDAIDIAAVWPTSAQLAPYPLPELERISEWLEFLPTPAAQDVPAAVGGMIAASYAGLIVALAVATAGSATANFAIAIAALFVVVFFTVPRIFFAVEPDSGPRANFDSFWRNGIDTLTGHNSGKSALIQMLVVPFLLTLAVLVMGIAVAIID